MCVGEREEINSMLFTVAFIHDEIMQKMSQRNKRLPTEISVQLNTSINILLRKCDDQFEARLLEAFLCIHIPLNSMTRERERKNEKKMSDDQPMRNGILLVTNPNRSEERIDVCRVLNNE